MILFNVAYGRAGGGLRAMAEAYESILSNSSTTVYGFRVGSKRPTKQSGLRFIPSSGHFNPVGCLLALFYLFQLRPDVVICHCTRSLSLFFLPCRLLGIPTVGVTHNDKLQRFTKADYMIAFSSVLESKLLDLDFARERIRILPNPVSSSIGDVSKKRFSDRSDVTSLRLGFLARLEARKGAHLAIETLSCLEGRSIDSHLLLGGEGEEKVSLLEQVSSLRLEERVDLLGWVNDPDTFFSEIDLFLVPSNYESFGLTIVEAFARRVPVITSRFYCFADNFFTDRVNCVLAADCSAESFAEAVQWCVENPDQVEAITNRAESDFYEHFAAVKVAEKLHGFFKEIVETTRQ